MKKTFYIKSQEEMLSKIKAIGITFDANGKYINPRSLIKNRILLPCDNVRNWLGDESCAKCPDPCKDDEDEE